MVKKTEYDFLNWTSFPSSIKLTNDTMTRSGGGAFENIPVNPGTVRVEVNGKTQDVQLIKGSGSYIAFWGHRADGSRKWIGTCDIRYGTHDWEKAEAELPIPADIVILRGYLIAGGGNKAQPSISWFDDFVIKQNGRIIYENKFSNWNPVIGAGIGAIIGGAVGELTKPIGPIASPLIGALGGAALGGGIGYALTRQVVSTPVAIPIERRYVIAQ